jgi:hypothetical protein
MARSSGFGQWKVERDVTVNGALPVVLRYTGGWKVKAPATALTAPGCGLTWIRGSTLTKSMPPPADRRRRVMN